MKINGVDIQTLGGKLIKYQIKPSSYNGRSYWEASVLSPVFIPGEYGFGGLEIDIFVAGASSKEVELAKSKINAVMINPTIVLDEVDTTIEYICAYANQPVIDKINEVGTIISYNFKTFTQGTLQSKTLTKTITAQTVAIGGTYKTEPIYEVVPAVDMVEFSINDFKLKNLKAGQKIIINSQDKTILVNGQNNFKNTEFWSFPVLQPGNNSIKLSNTNVDVVLKYNPRYV